MRKKVYFVALVVVALSLTKFSVVQARMGSFLNGEGTGAKISLFDRKTRSLAGHFKFIGKLWFFDGGKSTEVEDGTRVVDFSFGSDHPADMNNLQIRAVEDHFVLSSETRRFEITFPSMGFSALVQEIE